MINEIKSDQSAAATRPTQPLSSATHTTLNMLNKFNTSLLQLIPQLHPQHHYTLSTLFTPIQHTHCTWSQTMYNGHPHSTPSFFTFYTPHHLLSLPPNNSTPIQLLLTTMVLFNKIQHPTPPLLFHFLIFFYVFIFLITY